MPNAPEPRRGRFLPLLALITIVGGAVRVKVALTEPPHFDESYTAVHYVLGPFADLLTTYDEPNNHLFHSLLAWVSTVLFGPGPFALRLPALVAGIGLVAATGLVGRAVSRAALGGGGGTGVGGGSGAGDDKGPGGGSGAGDDTGLGGGDDAGLGGGSGAGDDTGLGGAGAGGSGAADAGGLVAAAIVAGAPPLVAYSANARGYTLVLLLMVVQLGLTLRLAERRGRAPRSWVGWVLCGALAIWTVPTAVLGVGVSAIWLVALRVAPRIDPSARDGVATDRPTGGPRPLWRRIVEALPGPVAAVVATGAIALALYSPVRGQRGFTVDRFTAAPVRDLATTLAHAWTAGLALPLLVAAVALAIYGLGRPRLIGPGTTLAVGLLALPIVIAVLGRVLPYSRTYLVLLPILALLAGVGAARLARRWGDRDEQVPRAAETEDPGQARTIGDQAPSPAPGDARPGSRPVARSAAVAALGFTALAILAGAGAQTREAWAEDPPGPSQDDLTTVAFVVGDAVSFHTGTLLAPPFDLPQVEYTLAAGPDRDEARRQTILASVGSVPPPGRAVLIFTRAAVEPDAALRELGLDPAAYAVSTEVRGDARAIRAAPR